MNIKSFFLSILVITFASPAMSWTISANFDSGQLGTEADKGGDGFSGAGGQSVYTAEQAFEGHAAKLTIKQGQTGYGNWGGVFNFPENVKKGDTIWFQVYTYFPVGFDHYSYGEGDRLKFLRISTLTSNNNDDGYIDLYIDKKGSPNPFKWIHEGAGVGWVDVGTQKDAIVSGKWESYQMRVTLDNVPLDLGGKAEVYIWKNGALLKHITSIKTINESTDHSSRALLFTYWNGGAPQTQSMYVDDITVTTDTPKGVDANGNSMIPSLIPNPPARIDSLHVE